MTIIHEIKNVDVKLGMGGDQEPLQFSEKQTNFIDEIWYYYFNCGYEGHGVALLRIGEQYSDCSLGHCSCNSPEDALQDIKINQYLPLNILLERLTKEYKKEFEPILKEVIK